MNPDQGQDHNEESSEDVPRASRSPFPGRSRILLVFGVLAVAAVAALTYFRDGGAGPGVPRSTELRASSMAGAAPSADARPAVERPEAPASAAAAPTAPVAAAPLVVAEGPKPTPAEPKATEKRPAATDKTTDKEMPAAKGPAAKAAPAKRAAAGPAAASHARPGEASRKPYWVQVGAFKDVDTANRVAAKLRDMNLRVELSELRAGGGTAAAAPPAPAPGAPAAAPEPPKSESDRYEVVASGPSPAEVSAKLAAKGLASQPTPDGAVITPSLPLGEAIALSKDLSGDNLKIRVRRVGAPPAAPAPPPREAAEKPAPAGDTLHRVRVGGFPDRTAAVTALRDLESKGYKPFLVRE
jgi:hypothetical protein